MSRPLRIEFAGALYHITARGNERRDVFFCDDDRFEFLKILEQVCERYNWLCHAYCLMGNHYHLLIETLDGNLSKGMRQLNGVYTQYVNRTHGRVGHLFQGRYKGILVQKEAYLLELARYIVLNPIRAGMVRKVEKWPWSSYPATVGLVGKPGFLMTDWLLSSFSKDRRVATRAYVRFVAEGKHGSSPWQVLKNQIYLGSDQFVKDMQRRIKRNQALSDIPKKQSRAPGKSLAYYANKYKERDKAMVEAYRSGSYSMREIGEFFGLGRMTVSRAVNRQVPRKTAK
jgi:REP-associated tyrosine transposase